MLTLVSLMLALAVIFAPVFAVTILEFGRDYYGHYKIAQRIQNGEALNTPHVFYHVLFIGLRSIFPLRVSLTHWLLVTSFRALLGVLLFTILKAQLSERLAFGWSGVVIVLFLLSAPLYMQPDPLDALIGRNQLVVKLGYLNYLVYHNPTQNLMMIFVVPVSLFALRAVAPQPYRNGNQRAFLTALSALLLTLMTLSKPSYLIALLPALGLAVLYRLVRRLPVDWWLLIFGLGLPAVLMLALQYVVAYGDPDRASVQIGVLTVFRGYGLQVWDVVLRHLLSLIFPLVAYLLHLKHALKDDYLNFSWLVFGASLIWSSFVHEGGARLLHGNFVWTAYAALFVLMFSSILFLLKHYAARAYKLTPGAVATLIAFGLHVISGVSLYFAILTFMN